MPKDTVVAATNASAPASAPRAGDPASQPVTIARPAQAQPASSTKLATRANESGSTGEASRLLSDVGAECGPDQQAAEDAAGDLRHDDEPADGVTRDLAVDLGDPSAADTTAPCLPRDGRSRETVPAYVVRHAHGLVRAGVRAPTAREDARSRATSGFSFVLVSVFAASRSWP